MYEDKIQGFCNSSQLFLILAIGQMSAGGGAKIFHIR